MIKHKTLYINGKFYAQNITGVQRYARQLLESFDRLILNGKWESYYRVVVVIPDLPGISMPDFKKIEVCTLKCFNLHFWEQVQLPWFTRGNILLNLSGSAPLIKFGQICTFHDAAIFDYPDAYNSIFVCWYRLLFKVQAKISARILTVSNFSKLRLVKLLGVCPDNVGIVNSAADHMHFIDADDNVLSKYGLISKNYFLAVGSVNPTKNFSRLMESFLGMNNAQLRLVVVGGINSGVFATDSIANIKDARIVNAGRLSDAELKSLYSHARVFIFPSIYEGFGLPPVEAMQCGCPVLAANAASIPEICGSAVGYFDPYSLESIREAMSRSLLDDDWLEKLRHAGMRHAMIYTWHNAAISLLQELTILGIFRLILARSNIP
jgi:glycosyltransferase involved in cell wall biosynthesis